MRIVQLNLAADPALRDPEALLEAYHTLTGWSEALTAAGATVHVVQRFPHASQLTRAGVSYEFVAEGPPGLASSWSVCSRVAAAVERAAPQVIHINGLMFPGMVRRLRAGGAGAVIVLQDHSGALPPRRPRPLSTLRSIRWGRAFQDADACSVTSGALLERWRPFGLPQHMRVLEIPEASTRVEPMDRDKARTTTGMHGAPTILWVGRLDRNKDPMTVLSGLSAVFQVLPRAHLWMIAPEGDLRADVRRKVAAEAALQGRVTVAGPVAHHEMAAYYSSADIFVSASHHEGSGYALIEAMACGVVPCVTDIASFRALTGGCAALWRVGDPAAFAHALTTLAAADLSERRAGVHRRFLDALSWSAVGRQTFDAYSTLIESRHAAR